MPVTIREVARRAGLSPITVSRVLGNQGTAHRAETRERVIRAARELGYLPNAAARATARGRFGCAALLVSAQVETGAMSWRLLEGIHDALAEHDMHLTIAKLPDEKLTSTGFVPRILREWMADGLLINYTHRIPGRMIELIEQYDIPSVWLNTKRRFDCVHPDDRRAGREATEHLLRLGHRHIAYVDFIWGTEDIHRAHYSTRDRQGGYEDAMAAAGLTPAVARDKRHVSRGYRGEMWRGLLASPDRPTAIVAYTTTPRIHNTAAEAGLRIPQDLSVVTFGERTYAESGRAITTMMLPHKQVGEAAGEAMVEKIENPKRRLAPRAVPLRMAEGDSCSRPPAGN
jgi:DNA-binding LacI/PurR family transcriptional regulator